MANVIKIPDLALRKASLQRFRQGGGVTQPLDKRRKRIVILFESFLLFGLSTAGTIDELFAAPSLSIFKALAQGPRALKEACEASPASAIDMPLNQAAQTAGARDFNPSPNRISIKQFTALQLCAKYDLWAEARVLLTYGANPNLFNADVTAIGLAAYTSSARVLCEMLSFGADATLYLKPEHAIGAPNVQGSTLLHRVSNRFVGSEKKAILLILAHCKESYPEVLPKALDGSTPLDWAEDDETRTTLLSVVAEREAYALKGVTAMRRKTSKPLRM